LLISTSPLPNFLLDSLEKQYPPLRDVSTLPRDSGWLILVLGAGHTDNPALPVTNQLSETELVRLVEGIRLYRLLPGSRLVTSGRKGKDDRQSQAAVVRKAAIALGVPPEQVDTLAFTINTRDEALHFREKFGPATPLLLVTDAVHIPRAMQWFRKMGLQPIAAPTNHQLKDEPSKRPLRLLPNSGSISRMEMVVHEYLGMVWLGMRDEG
jgi:uncharacterized SAM-binding protein YcdF (DUF218 family)